ncbi:hypothetical protein BACCAP_00409 [Pseudoflavonifractor capillosus ATCC 29799]|uniref:Uncharacterized protein n=1 Tax=Pseudoflavonifractor capillosus ATCC 29799 TaxID=411467 RepID=A6NQD9_9FIRM|nr:hypothetical protein BACCAP_00409 [Pseudoflavonifractor capillosus ATCC 29799]
MPLVIGLVQEILHQRVCGGHPFPFKKMKKSGGGVIRTGR